MDDLAEFKEFLAFKAMKAAVAAAPAAAPDMTGAAAARTRMAAIVASAAPPPLRKFNWVEKLPHILNFIFATKHYMGWHSKGEWWLWRSIYMSDPSAFHLIGELHNDPVTSETYISARYNFPTLDGTDNFVTFHIYGSTSGFRFLATRMTWCQNGYSRHARPLWALTGMSGSHGSGSDSASTAGSAHGSE